MNFQSLCEQTLTLVQDTSDFIASQLGRVRPDEIEDKSINSLVSYVDKTAEERLVEGCRALLPAASFVTEEETVATHRGRTYWVIDPLDGTTNFLHELPFFSISLALVHDGAVVMGIVHEVTRSESFYAYGEGAFLNGKPLQVSRNTALINALIATGFPYTKLERIDKHLQMLKYLKFNARGLRRFGSAALDLAYVAAGRFDAYFEYGLQPWDVAAGSFLVQQAGGLVTDFAGGDDYLFSGELVVGSPAIQPILLDLVQRTSVE